jgi:hypothetical protein
VEGHRIMIQNGNSKIINSKKAYIRKKIDPEDEN